MCGRMCRNNSQKWGRKSMFLWWFNKRAVWWFGKETKDLYGKWINSNRKCRTEEIVGLSAVCCLGGTSLLFMLLKQILNSSFRISCCSAFKNDIHLAMKNNCHKYPGMSSSRPRQMSNVTLAQTKGNETWIILERCDVNLSSVHHKWSWAGSWVKVVGGRRWQKAPPNDQHTPDPTAQSSLASSSRCV